MNKITIIRSLNMERNSKRGKKLFFVINHAVGIQKALLIF